MPLTNIVDPPLFGDNFMLEAKSIRNEGANDEFNALLALMGRVAGHDSFLLEQYCSKAYALLDVVGKKTGSAYTEMREMIRRETDGYLPQRMN